MSLMRRIIVYWAVVKNVNIVWGDPITIKVAQANLERKQLDFQLAE